MAQGQAVQSSTCSEAGVLATLTCKIKKGAEEVDINPKSETPITGCESYTGSQYKDCINSQLDDSLKGVKDPCGNPSSPKYIKCLLGDDKSNRPKSSPSTNTEPCWDPGLGPGCYGPIDCTKTIQEGVCTDLNNNNRPTSTNPSGQTEAKEGNEHHDTGELIFEGAHTAHTGYELYEAFGHEHVPPVGWVLSLPFTMPSDSPGPGYQTWSLDKVPQEFRKYCGPEFYLLFGPKGILAPSYCSIQEP